MFFLGLIFVWTTLLYGSDDQNEDKGICFPLVISSDELSLRRNLSCFLSDDVQSRARLPQKVQDKMFQGNFVIPSNFSHSSKKIQYNFSSDPKCFHEEDFYVMQRKDPLHNIEPVLSIVRNFFIKTNNQNVLEREGIPSQLYCNVETSFNGLVYWVEQNQFYPSILKQDSCRLREALSHEIVKNMHKDLLMNLFYTQDESCVLNVAAMTELFVRSAQNIADKALSEAALQNRKKDRDAKKRNKQVSVAGDGASCGAAVAVASQVSNRNGTNQSRDRMSVQPQTTQELSVDEILNKLRQEEQLEKEKRSQEKQMLIHQQKIKSLAQEKVRRKNNIAAEEKMKKELEELRADKEQYQNELIAKGKDLKLFKERTENQNNSDNLKLAARLNVALGNATNLLGKDTTTVQKAGQIVQSFKDKYKKDWEIIQAYLLTNNLNSASSTDNLNSATAQGCSTSNYDNTQEDNETYQSIDRIVVADRSFVTDYNNRPQEFGGADAQKNNEVTHAILGPPLVESIGNGTEFDDQARRCCCACGVYNCPYMQEQPPVNSFETDQNRQKYFECLYQNDRPNPLLTKFNGPLLTKFNGPCTCGFSDCPYETNRLMLVYHQRAIGKQFRLKHQAISKK